MEFAKFVNLLSALNVRELKGRYRRSILGPAWAIIQPLLYMVVFTFIKGVLKISSEGVPYSIFTYSAIVPWMLFSNGIIRCGPIVMNNRAIIKKIALPREIFPISAMVTSFIDFLIASIILVGMMVWFKVPVTVHLLWLPVLVILTISLSLGIGLGIASVGTYKNDFLLGLPFLMQLWMLSTPIMYSIEEVPDRWLFAYKLNPMVGVIEAFRAILVKGMPPDLGLLLFSFIVALVIWIVMWPLFRYMSQYFADVL